MPVETDEMYGQENSREGLLARCVCDFLSER